jgi:hypothetical protein
VRDERSRGADQYAHHRPLHPYHLLSRIGTPSPCRDHPPDAVLLLHSSAERLCLALATGRTVSPRRTGNRTSPRSHALDFERANAIGSYWANSKTRIFAELLIDCEEDRMLRVVLVGMLPEGGQASSR